jgi:DDE superfamily endonuclease/Winged helix-turn helix
VRNDGAAARSLKKWVAETLPRTTTAAGEWIESTCGINYTRSAIFKLRKRLGMEYRKPKALPRKLDPAKQEAFIKEYEDLLNSLSDAETVVFADAVHPTHEARPAGCWAPKGQKIGIGQTSGRDRFNIHGAIYLETRNTRMIEVLTVNALSTIALLMAIEIMYPFKRWIHVFLDNARYHHADMEKEWLAREVMPDQTARERSASNALDARRVAERSSRLTVPILIRLSDYGG